MECSQCLYNNEEWACSRCIRLCCYVDKDSNTIEEVKDIYFNKVCNVNYLKKQLKDVGRVLLDNRYSNEMLDGFFFPLRYYEDLRFLAAQYGAKFKLAKPRKREDNSSFYRRSSRRIFLITNSAGFIGTWDVCRIYTHELAHAIQHNVMLAYGVNDYPATKLSEVYLFERTADRLAYFIYKKYFYSPCTGFLTHRNFKAYRSKESLEFLYNFRKRYKRAVDDDMGVTINR